MILPYKKKPVTRSHGGECLSRFVKKSRSTTPQKQKKNKKTIKIKAKKQSFAIPSQKIIFPPLFSRLQRQSHSKNSFPMFSLVCLVSSLKDTLLLFFCLYLSLPPPPFFLSILGKPILVVPTEIEFLCGKVPTLCPEVFFLDQSDFFFFFLVFCVFWFVNIFFFFFFFFYFSLLYFLSSFFPLLFSLFFSLPPSPLLHH